MAHEEKGLLRFLTAGSVDDGKSTLIGRLLYDSKLVFDDHLKTLARDSRRLGSAGSALDYSLLVDGLRAEREQGITIDVAYRYFSTPARKFIIADTPGHEQYTRNMATGASTADLALILVDARLGVLRQTRRHSFIASLLGIKHLVVVVNKMDLVEWDEAVFEAIRRDYTDFAARLQISDVHFIPISALAGDNVVHRSEAMPWYAGAPLLDYLETVHIAGDRNLVDFRFPVQTVIRPDTSFRGYCGTVASGTVRPGDEVVVLPSGRTTFVERVCTWDGDLEVAFPPQAVTLTLTDDLDVGRGDMVARVNNLPLAGSELDAMVVWMAEEPLRIGDSYLVKHTTNTVGAVVTTLHYRVEMDGLHREESSTLELNDIGRVRLELRRPIAYDTYRSNRSTGSFILIDPRTNGTVGAGMIAGRRSRDDERPKGSDERGSVAGERGLIIAGNDDAARRQAADEAVAHLKQAGQAALIVDLDDLISSFDGAPPSPRLWRWILTTARTSGLVPVVLCSAATETPVDDEWIVRSKGVDREEGAP